LKFVKSCTADGVKYKKGDEPKNIRNTTRAKLIDRGLLAEVKKDDVKPD